MSSKTGGSGTSADYSVIVVASPNLLREAVKKVLFDCSVHVETLEGDKKFDFEDLRVGDTLVYRENLDHMPAEIIAVKIGEQQWFVISSTDMPESGYPTTKDAMKVAAAERKKLAIIKEHLAREAGNLIIENLENIESWQPDPRKDAHNIRKLIQDAKERWGH